MKLFQKKTVTKEYDRTREEPAVRKSICTKEATAGFRDLKTGKFRDVMLIQNQKDLLEFKELYGITEDLKTIY